MIAGTCHPRRPQCGQRRFDGTPVIETRVRIPDGDAVHRVWCVADRGGLTVIEIENDSPLPFAVAFFGRSVLTERSPSDVRIQGIELPDDAVTMPVAHHTSIRVAIPHGPLPAGVGPHAVSLASLPSAATVARWVGSADRPGKPDRFARRGARRRGHRCAMRSHARGSCPR